MLILASSSAARRALLSQITREFVVVECAHDENFVRSGPGAYARLCAVSKIRAVVNAHPQRRERAIISADTVLFCRNTILGRPANRAQAGEFLRMLSGNWCEVCTVTAVSEFGQKESDWRCATDFARVRLKTLTDSDIRQWCHNNDPTRYAGALALQGHCAAWVRRLQGAYSTVVGLPLATTRRLLADIAGRGQDSHTKALP